MSGEYDDIIALPHHVSKSRRQMPVSDRAAQFAPFSALTGYGDTVSEVQRLTSERIELDEYEKELIDRKLQYIFDNIKNKPKVKIIYFIYDSKKSGGEYKTVEETVYKIDDFERKVILSSKKAIDIDEIFSLEICEKTENDISNRK
ncbi:MAG: YolD-like family protein [Ruminococcaceae bacterium]|nr:YolD-like family protein [Oscillospiraceae bacterium]